MNYKYVILIITFLFGMTDWVTYNRPRLQKQLFNGLFIFLYLSTIICYYYGIDIGIYYQHFYSETPTLPLLLTYPDSSWFEPAYKFLVSTFRTAGWSLYVLCVVTWTAFYFTLWKLFSTFSNTWRAFAMMIIMGFCWDVIIYAIRQTWALTFFMALVITMRKKQYFWAVLWAITTILIHRSGFVIITLFTITYILFHRGFSKGWYALLTILLLVQLFIPPSQAFFQPILDLPIISAQRQHLEVLLFRGRTFSPAIILYLSFLIVGYRLDDQHNKLLSVVYLMGCTCCVFMYRYVFLIIRFQYYLMPFMCIFLMNALYEPLRQSFVRRKLLRTTIVACFTIYWGYTFFYKGPHTDGNQPAFQTSTIFERRNYSAPYLQARQLERVARSREMSKDFEDSQFVTHTK